jgi:hypothetical protein
MGCRAAYELLRIRYEYRGKPARMSHRVRTTLLLAACLQFAAGGSGFARYTTVDTSAVVNTNVPINAWTIPTGITEGNQGTGVPFAISTYGDWNYAGAWAANGGARTDTGSGTLTIDLRRMGISGGATIYALLNTYWGTAGLNEYEVTVTETNGASVTFSSIGGIDTRDYNQNPDTDNTVGNATRPWFDDGVGQRLDMREFRLPSQFFGDTLASFTITQIENADPAVFSGLTFNVPEPGSLALLAGIFGLGLARRQHR